MADQHRRTDAGIVSPDGHLAEPILELDHLRTDLPVNGGLQPVVRDVSVVVAQGEAVGLVGESGSGKSITARSVVGLLPHGSRVEGGVRIAGVDRLSMSGEELRRVRAEQVAMVFQDPRAHVDPLWRIEDYVGEGLRAHKGLTRAAARERSATLLTSLGIVDPDRVLRSYPGELSGGMLQRVMIAGALSCEPALIIDDEATTALDVTVQTDILAIFQDLRASTGLSLLFITHDLGLASVICDRIVVMYAGHIMAIQDSASLFTAPAHPYAAALVAARPKSDRRVERLPSVPGRPVSALEAPTGCPFRTRCAYALDACAEADMTLTPLAPSVSSSCVRMADIADALVESVAGDD
ncbi:MAG: ABC transporter ATP-binding protein [Nostocoides sp.]